jgi:hypothetical protein
MLKKLLGSVALVLLLGTGMLLADEAKGKVKKVEKGKITVTVGDKDVEFTVGGKGFKGKVFDGDTEITGKDRGAFLKDLKEGSEVTVKFDKDGDKTTVTEFKVTKK